LRLSDAEGGAGSNHPRVFQSAFDLLSQSPEAYLIVFAIALGDGVFPAFPSESIVIVAGLLCVVGDLSLGWVILAGALGAFAGDNISYALGRFVGRPAQERFLNGERSQRALAWARRQLAERGGLVIILGRYVPGGRTAVTFTAGVTHYSYPRFAGYDTIAAASWATYAALLGYFGGRFFEHHVWAALLLAFGIAAGVTLGVEGVRRWRK
jgi:membrane protein DedA with SNARE-associated domain